MAAMGKVEIRIPLVTWREGRPRFIPGAAARKLGYKGTDLRFPAGAGPDVDPQHVRPGDKHTGRWFSLDEAIIWSKVTEAEIADARKSVAEGVTTPRRLRNAATRAAAAGMVTLGQLSEAFLDPNANPRMGGKEIVEGRKKRRPLAANTVRAYRGSSRLIERFDDGRIWHAPAAAISGVALAGILDRIEQRHGLAQARAVRAFLSAAYGWGITRKKVQFNPVASVQQKLPMLKPRVHFAQPHELVTFLAGCDALGWPEVADIVCAGAWTGQRQGDRLSLTASQLTADGILFRPHKKDAEDQKLLIPLSSHLAARLEAARTRRKGWRVNSLNLFLNERLRRPWEPDWYRKVYRVLKLAIATGELEKDDDGKPTKEALAVLGEIDIPATLAAAGVAITPALAELRDQDLRDTNVTWLGLAGADKFEIAGFTGHAFGADDKVLGHYFAIPPEFARRGMAKLEAWFAERVGTKGEETEAR